MVEQNNPTQQNLFYIISKLDWSQITEIASFSFWIMVNQLTVKQYFRDSTENH